MKFLFNNKLTIRHSISFKLIALTCIILLVSRCETEEVLEVPEKSLDTTETLSNSKYRYPTNIEINELKAVFNQHLNQAGLSEHKNNIYYKDMVVLVKANNFLTFSTYIKLPNSAKGFYNIAVRKSSVGEYGKPYLVKFSESLLEIDIKLKAIALMQKRN